MNRARKCDTTGRLIAHDASIILAGEEFKGGLSVYHDGRWRWFGPTRLRALAGRIDSDMPNEHTSKRVAKIAGRILAADVPVTHAWFTAWTSNNSKIGSYKPMRVTWDDIRALAASCLTQAEDHAERADLRAGKLPRGHKRIKTHKPVLRRFNHR